MTESGLSTVLSLVQKVEPNLTIKASQGRLYDGASLSDIHYQIDPDNSMDIGQLNVKWQAQQLFYGRLMLDSLVINDIALSLTSDDTVNTPIKPIVLPDIALPIAIYIAHLQLTNLSLEQNSQPRQQLISELRSDIAFNANTLELKQFTVNKTDQFDLNVSGKMQLTGKYQTALDYQWHYLQAGLADVAANGTIEGNVVEMKVEQDMTRPVQSHQQLIVQQLFDQLTWQLGISADHLKFADIDKTQQGELNTLLIDASGDLNQAKVELNSQLAYPELPEVMIHNLSSSTDFTNWLTDLTVQVKDQPSMFKLNGKLNDVINNLQVSLSGQWQQLVWPLTGSEPTMSSQQGQFMLTGGLDDYHVQLKTDLTTQQQLMNVELAAQGSTSQLTLKQLTLNGLGGTAEVSGTTSWQTLPVQFDLKSVWADITLPESLSSQAVSSTKGTLAITGTTDSYSMTSSTDLMIDTYPVSVALKALGSTDQLSQFTIDSKLATGTAHFAGQLSWQQTLSLLGDLKFDKLDPQIVAAQWPGNLSGEGHISFIQDDKNKQSLDVSKLHVKGTLRQRPLSVDADLHYVDGTLDVSGLAMQSGQSSLTMAGAISDNMTFNWQLKSPDLADFYPELAGQLQATGNVSGTLAAPMVAAKISGQNVSYADRIAVQMLSSDVSLDLQEQGQIQATLTLNNMALDSFSQINSKLSLTGNNSDHHLALELSNQDIAIEASADGNYDKQLWQGHLSKLQIDSKRAGVWTMTESAPIALSQQTQTIGRHCLGSAQQSALCIAASHDGTDGRWQSQGQLSKIPMTLLHDLSVDLEAVTGDINGQFMIAGKGSYPTSGSGQFSLNQGIIHNAIESQQEIGLKQAKVDYVLTTDNTIATVLIEPDVVGTSAIVGEIKLPNMTHVIDQPNMASLSGKLTTHIDDLAVFGPLNPSYENLHGQLLVDVKLAGTVAKPLFTGDIVLNNGGVELPSLGIILTELQAKANANLADGVVFDYHAKSGDGVLSGQGTVVFEDKGWQLNTSLKGDDVQLVSLPEAYVVASPDLIFAMTAEQASVTGKVVIPSAELAPAEFNMTVKPSDDVVIINEVAVDQKSAFPTTVKVALSLGDKVFVTGVGFRARLTGQLAVSGVTNDVLLGTGEIVIKDGSYIAYGQKLIIDDGKVIFAGGALDNPNLDVKAVRKGSDFTAGLKIEGSAADPQISLFSDPTMDQDNILAHLILGRPLAEASVTDAALLATAATGLGLTGGGQISDQISSAFGLDTLAISGNGSDDTALQVGKYLSPKLYLGYGIGIFEPVSTVTLRYKLSKIWSLKAESGVETGVDFLYTHESKND